MTKKHYVVFMERLSISFELDTQKAKEGLKPTPNSAYKLTSNPANYPAPEEKLDNKTGKPIQKTEDYNW
jgi:hypothetical protein